MEVSPGTLWIVATPIGTADDCSPRVLGVLERADQVLAEDTRRTRSLLSRWGVEGGGSLRPFHEHNERRLTPEIVRAIQGGAVVALVSDAGTPVLSDPGFVLVRAVREARLPVLSVPGPSAFTTALAASGQPPLPATLVGYLPPKPGPRRSQLRALGTVPGSLVVMVSPHRLAAELEACATELGADRPATLLAELSKVHERGIVSTLGNLAVHPEARNPRGEYILVVGPPERRIKADPDPRFVRETYEGALGDGLSRREAMRRTARELGVPRRVVFNLLEHG